MLNFSFKNNKLQTADNKSTELDEMIHFKWFVICSSGVNFGRTNIMISNWHQSFQVITFPSLNTALTYITCRASPSHCSNITVDWFPSASLAKSTTDQRKQSQHYSSVAFSNRSKAPVWPTSQTWRVSFTSDCHSCISMTWIAPCTRLKALLYLAFSLAVK